VTFFKLGIEGLSAVLFANDSAIALHLPMGVNLNTSTLATRSCSSTIGFVIPAVDVDLLQRDPLSRKWDAVGSLQTSLSVDVYKAPKDWREKAARQQAFIRKEDAPTQRVWYMYREGTESSGRYS